LLAVGGKRLRTAKDLWKFEKNRMKSFFLLFALLVIVSCAAGKERKYTGSTPANTVLRSFLNISLTDSIDFIRWELSIDNNHYTLNCSYGISKPNTNGFMNGGALIRVNGSAIKENHYLRLQNENKTLYLLEVNNDLLHVLNDDKSLLPGTDGWAYTLNSLDAHPSDQFNIVAKQAILKDSMIFMGRTPCGVPGVIEPGKLCYKLKWYIVLYAKTKTNQPLGYRILGTAWRREGGRTGTWKIITGKNGRTIYQLNEQNGNRTLYLLKLDDNVVIFTDANGKLLVGNQDFSYTLSRK